MKRTILLVVFFLTVGLVTLAQAQTGTIGTFPPPNNGTTGFTFQPSTSTYHFTRTDGTFSNMLVFDNSAEPGYPNTNDFSADGVNVDGQRELVTYHYNTQTGTYGISSLLDLDEDGHFALGSSSGGGIGSDPSTGDTCIPINVLSNGTCNVTGALHINSQGTVSQYLGLPLDSSGHGTSMIARSVNGSATGTVTNYPVWTTPASGYGASDFYEVSWVGVVTTPAFGAKATATWNFTDESGPNSCSSATTPFGAPGNRIELTCRFYSMANTPVSLSVTTLGGSPTYASHLRVLIH
jgi:hypothetical protein